MTQPASNTYPPDWDAIAECLKDAAGWRCERCGHPDTPGLCAVLQVRRGHLPCDAGCSHLADGKQRVLTVHHLDGDKANVEGWNLAALCQVCHLAIQGKVVFYRPYLLPHTPWMARHVRGYNEWAAANGRPALPYAGEWPA